MTAWPAISSVASSPFSVRSSAAVGMPPGLMVSRNTAGRLKRRNMSQSSRPVKQRKSWVLTHSQNAAPAPGVWVTPQIASNRLLVSSPRNRRNRLTSASGSVAAEATAAAEAAEAGTGPADVAVSGCDGAGSTTGDGVGSTSGGSACDNQNPKPIMPKPASPVPSANQRCAFRLRAPSDAGFGTAGRIGIMRRNACQKASMRPPVPSPRRASRAARRTVPAVTRRTP